MTNSVTFPVNLGGDGSTVTDDDNASTGLGNGGHRTRFVPAMGQIVAVANTLTQRLAEQSDTSTTSLTIATGSKSFVTAGFYEWAVGMYVVAASTSSPANRMYGQVTSWTTSTNTLVVNVLAIDGSGTFSSWTVSLSGPPNLTTLPNVISVNSTTDALRITQLGTGNALLVEDSSNPDATPFVIDAVGGLGLGVTPSAWATLKAMDIGTYTGVAGGNGYAYFSGNAYLSTYPSTWTYKDTNLATLYTQVNGQHIWKTAPSGTAGNAISFTQAMTLDASGRLVIGDTSTDSYLKVLMPDGATANLARFQQTNQGNLLIQGQQGGQSLGGPNGILFSNATGVMGWRTNASSGYAQMILDGSGNLLVGTTSQLIGTGATITTASRSSSVQVNIQAANGTGYDANLYFECPGSFGATIQAQRSSGLLRIWNGAGSAGVTLAGSGTSWGTFSDERLKDIIEPIENAVSKVNGLRAVIAKYKTDANDKRRSVLIAQDVEAVLPEAVYDDKSEEKYLSVAYTDTIPLLVAAIKELAAELNELKKRVG